MDKTGKIRVIAIALIKNDNKILATQLYDSKKKEKFYRPLGGGVEFGETAEQALKREYLEEINCPIKNIKLLGIVENIFTFEAMDGHEIVYIFKADLGDKCIYKQSQIDRADDITKPKPEWIPITTLKKSNFYPKGIKKYI